MGIFAGTTIFGHPPTEDARDNAIDGLNNGDLNGLVMTDRVGGCGHDLTGANVMIFMGSLYLAPYEEQAIGTSQCLLKLLIVARICRPGQLRLPKIYIIADPDFEGDRMAFEIKSSRQAEGDLMKTKFDKKNGHFRSLGMVHALLGDEEEWAKWKAQHKEYEKQQLIKQKIKSSSSSTAAPPKVSPLSWRPQG